MTEEAVAAAVMALMNLAKAEPDARLALERVVNRTSHKDIYAWASDDPETFMTVAGDMLEAFDQIHDFERRVAQGDIS